MAKKELALECDYTYEAGAQARFRDLLRGEEADYYVPEVFGAHSGPRILCTEFVEGVPIDQVAGMDQAARNRVAELIFRLTIKESKKFCAAAGGVAAKRSSWGIQGAKARSSLATNLDL